METKPDLPTEERILQLLRHLGVQKAHFAARVPEDWSGLAAKHPQVISSMTLVCPNSIDPGVLGPLASRLLVFTGDIGPPANIAQYAIAQYAMENIADASVVVISDYAGFGLADVIADRTGVIGDAMTDFLALMSQRTETRPVVLPQGEGEVAGITYHVQGSGPPFVLLPLALAPSQWEPLLPRLSERYCTITLGGAELGYVGILEARGRAGPVGLVRTLMDEVQLLPGETILDVGCGTGVLDRWLAHRIAGSNRVVGLDISSYLLQEAVVLAKKEGIEEAVEFVAGNGEVLPFPDGSFDVTMAVTVLDFADADRMLAEMIRVTTSGGRVAVIVRAVDIPSVVNLPVRAELRTKVEAMMSGFVEEHGCADADLYRRFKHAGLVRVKMFPQLAVSEDRLALEFLQGIVLSTLKPEEADEWRAAEAQARAEGTFFLARPYHCAVGTKP